MLVHELRFGGISQPLQSSHSVKEHLVHALGALAAGGGALAGGGGALAAGGGAPGARGGAVLVVVAAIVLHVEEQVDDAVDDVCLVVVTYK